MAGRPGLEKGLGNGCTQAGGPPPAPGWWQAYRQGEVLGKKLPLILLAPLKPSLVAPRGLGKGGGDHRGG